MDDITDRLRGFAKLWLSIKTNCETIHGINDVELTTDDLSEAAAEIDRLRAENFMLAAGVCINPGQHGLVGDEWGNSICTAHEALLAEEKAHSEAAAEIEQLRSQLAARDREIAGLRLDVAAQQALHVSAYRAGMKAGWNFCDSRDHEGYLRAQEGTEHIAELKRIRAERGDYRKEKSDGTP